MNESTPPFYLEQFSQIFSRLTAQDVEQFYADYQRWSLYQELAAAQQKLSALQEQLAENAAQIERVRPSAIALATLTRLQASGVEDIDLLDRMLDRGEDWLDHTIQHLEYCEQHGVIRDNYEEWCRHALEDAFVWLDTLQSAASETRVHMLETASPPLTPDDQSSSGEANEELLLQKLMSEDSEEPTLKIAAQPPARDVVLDPHDRPTADAISDSTPTDTITQTPTSVDDEKAATDGTHNQPSTNPTSDIIPMPTDATTSADNDEVTVGPQPTSLVTKQRDTSEESVGAQFIAPVAGMSAGEAHEQRPTGVEPKKQEETAPRRPHFLRRLLLALWR